MSYQEEDLSISQVKLIFIHVVLNHPEEITLERFVGNDLYISNHPVALYDTDNMPFEIPRMVSGSYELADCFQELIRLDSSKMNLILMLYHEKDYHEREWGSERQNPSKLFFSVHAEITNNSQS